MVCVYIGFVIFLLVMVLCTVENGFWDEQEPYIIDIADYNRWLSENYIFANGEDLTMLQEDEEVFEKYLKEHKLPHNSELGGF